MPLFVSSLVEPPQMREEPEPPEVVPVMLGEGVPPLSANRVAGVNCTAVEAGCIYCFLMISFI